MTEEAIILAGGLGTRLKSVISDIPKPMAPIHDKPFLEYLLSYLVKFKIKKTVLSVGYKYQYIFDHFGDNYKGIELLYAIEDKPLGTGGGIRNAVDHINNDHFFLLNGDTYYETDLDKLYHLHIKEKANITLSLLPMEKFSRYGSVKVNGTKIIEFMPKKFTEKGLINGGVYVVNRSVFQKYSPGKKFSFETDLLQVMCNSLNFHGYISEAPFIDIGIPEDYKKAHEYFS
ncbi:MAG: nucleotidyltransferase family protein [Bacteroidetes bacterium]|nr:nucleotidyltransferase family protein [Bacteroidota bacterium]